MHSINPVILYQRQALKNAQHYIKISCSNQAHSWLGFCLGGYSTTDESGLAYDIWFPAQCEADTAELKRAISSIMNFLVQEFPAITDLKLLPRKPETVIAKSEVVPMPVLFKDEKLHSVPRFLA